MFTDAPRDSIDHWASHMFSKQLTRSGEVKRFSIVTHELGDGWEVRVEQNSTIVRQTRYSDWHRVERALLLIEREVSELEHLGWQAEPVIG